MIASKTLLIIILSFTSFQKEWLVGDFSKDCESLKVTYDLKEKSNGYSLDFLIKGGQAPYKIILSKESGELVAKDFELKHFDGLVSGRYEGVIIDNQNCKKKIEIAIP